MIFTEAVKAFVEACGCRPPLCHACGEELPLGERITWSRPLGPKSVMIHEACVGEELTIQVAPEVRERIMDEFGKIAAELGGPMAAVEAGWQSEDRVRGCPLGPAEFAALGV